MSAAYFQEVCPTKLPYAFLISLILGTCNKAAILNKVLTTSRKIPSSFSKQLLQLQAWQLTSLPGVHVMNPPVAIFRLSNATVR
jgi:hypothetical protein